MAPPVTITQKMMDDAAKIKESRKLLGNKRGRKHNDFQQNALSSGSVSSQMVRIHV